MNILATTYHAYAKVYVLLNASMSYCCKTLLYININRNYYTVTSRRSCNYQMVASKTTCNGDLWTSGVERNNNLISAFLIQPRNYDTQMQNISFTFFIQSLLIESLKLLDFLLHNVSTNETCFFTGKMLSEKVQFANVNILQRSWICQHVCIREYIVK